MHDTITNQEKRSVLDRKPSHIPDRKANDRLRNGFRKPRDGKTGRYTAHETDAHDAEEDPNSEEEESILTAAFESEMDELASVVEELEDTLDVEDLREHSRVHVRGTRHQQRDTRKTERKESRLPAFFISLFSAFGSRHASLSGTGRGKGKTRPKGGSVHQKKFVTRRFDRNRFGHWSGDPICPRKANTMRRHILRVAL